MKKRMEYLKISYTLTLTIPGECVIGGDDEEDILRKFYAIAENEPESLAPGMDRRLFERYLTEVDDDWYEDATEEDCEEAEISFE